MKTNIEQYKMDWDKINPTNELNQRLRRRILSEVGNMEDKKDSSESIEINFNQRKSKKYIMYSSLAACIAVALIIAGGIKLGLINTKGKNITADNANRNNVETPKSTKEANNEVTGKIDKYIKCDFDKEYKYDLDGDGKEDIIKCTTKNVLVDKDTQTYEFDITVDINGITYKIHQYDGYLEKYFFIMDLNCKDNYMEIGIVSPGPSDDPTTEVVVYDNNKISDAGTVPSYVDKFKFNDDGTFEANKRLSIIQTWYAYQSYSLNNNKIVEEKQNLFYPDKIKLNLLIDLNLYSEADENSKVLKVTPQACYFDIIDDKEWAHLKFSDGSEGWIKVKDYCVIVGMENNDINSIFKGLIQCD